MEIASLLIARGEVLEESQPANGEPGAHSFEEFLVNSSFDDIKANFISETGAFPCKQEKASEEGMNVQGKGLLERALREGESNLPSNQVRLEDNIMETDLPVPEAEESPGTEAGEWGTIAWEGKAQSACLVTDEIDVNGEPENADQALSIENAATLAEGSQDATAGVEDKGVFDPREEVLNASEKLDEPAGKIAELPSGKDSEKAGTLAVDDLIDSDEPPSADIKNTYEKTSETAGNMHSGEEGQEEFLLSADSGKPEKSSGGLAKKINTETENEKGLSRNIAPETPAQGEGAGQNEGRNGNGMERNIFISKVSGGGGERIEKNDVGPFTLSRSAGAEQPGGMERVELTRLSMKGERGEVKMFLNPPSLGRLNVELNISDDRVNAVFHADSQAVKTILEANLPSLREALTAQDLKPGSFDVRTDSGGREGLHGERAATSDRREGEREDLSKNGEEIHNSDENSPLFLSVTGVDIFA